nr:uncharacterized protein CI109_003907 [Kwoniella shandongensis]KAA5527648.1 hypothetical protein CI109_003907 [Kwoniella shandongensis]
MEIALYLSPAADYQPSISRPDIIRKHHVKRYGIREDYSYAGLTFQTRSKDGPDQSYTVITTHVQPVFLPGTSEVGFENLPLLDKDGAKSSIRLSNEMFSWVSSPDKETQRVVLLKPGYSARFFQQGSDQKLTRNFTRSTKIKHLEAQWIAVEAEFDKAEGGRLSLLAHTAFTEPVSKIKAKALRSGMINTN